MPVRPRSDRQTHTHASANKWYEAKEVARPERVELPTFWFVVRFEIQSARVFKRIEIDKVDEITVCRLSWESFAQLIVQHVSVPQFGATVAVFWNSAFIFSTAGSASSGALKRPGSRIMTCAETGGRSTAHSNFCVQLRPKSVRFGGDIEERN